jgi:phosphoserine phosphatase RsbU/P
LVEAVNASDEEYGETKVLALLENAGSTSPQDLLNRLMAGLDLFVGNTAQHDDVTCMLLKA